jgi:hypothetical protein
MVIFDPDRKAESAIDVCSVIEISHGVNDVIETARHQVTHNFGPKNDVLYAFAPLRVRRRDELSLGAYSDRRSPRQRASAKRLIEPKGRKAPCAREHYTSRLCTTAASTKDENSGCGSNGRDLSSG